MIEGYIQCSDLDKMSVFTRNMFVSKALGWRCKEQKLLAFGSKAISSRISKNMASVLEIFDLW